MIYCMSDIHGDWRRYLSMLAKINLTKEDTLYIIGDVIDRGIDGLDILLDIMHRTNVHLLLGNHEEMLLQTVGPNNMVGARQLWSNNGGDVTRQDFLHYRDADTRKEIVEFLLNCPDHADIEVGNQKFHLVHGYPGEDRYHRLWSRPNVNVPQPIPDTITIVGHTPTVYYAEETDKPMSIWHKNGVIDIDCGCGHKSPIARLACLRLDDMQEFYIDKPTL